MTAPLAGLGDHMWSSLLKIILWLRRILHMLITPVIGIAIDLFAFFIVFL